MDKKKVNSIQKAYAFWNNNEDIIKKSSSGGAFSSVAEYFLENHGVVYGAMFDENFNVVIDRIEKKSELYKLRGSKYVRANSNDFLAKVKNDLLCKKLVLFSGTPCQVFLLKKYLKQDFDNLFCIDIICHGTPTPKIFKKYVNYLEKKFNSKIIEFYFRYKKEDDTSYIRVKFENNNVFEEPFSPKVNMYAKIFYSNIALMKGCTKCCFNNLDREGDITIGDFWGIQYFKNIVPNKYGNSLVIVNTKKGKEFLKKIEDKSNKIEVKLKDVVKYNPPLYEHTISNPLSSIFYKLIDNCNFVILYFAFLKILPIMILPYRIMRKLKRKVL